jgi:hypothetical protein
MVACLYMEKSICDRSTPFFIENAVSGIIVVQDSFVFKYCITYVLDILLISQFFSRLVIMLDPYGQILLRRFQKNISIHSVILAMQ